MNVLTNRLSLAYTALSSTVWKLLEPNDITSFAATVTKVARDPISKSRQRRKGTAVNLEAPLAFDGDLTGEHVKDFTQGFLFASANHPTGGTAASQPEIRSGSAPFGLALSANDDIGGAVSGFEHTALANALTAGTILRARGFSTAANNGAFIVGSSATTTATPVTDTLVDETPGNQANATIEIAGHRFPTGALAWDPDDLTLTKTSGPDFDDLGLTVGQTVHVGGQVALNQFTEGAGYGRITVITSDVITLDKVSTGLISDEGAFDGTGLDIDLLFGYFIRNVDVDDSRFLEQEYDFELAMPNLANPGGGTLYSYGRRAISNTASIAIPLTDKATVSYGFVARDVEVPTASQDTNADVPLSPVQTAAMNTSSNIVRLRLRSTLDDESLTTCFKDITLLVDNGVTPENCLGAFGPSYLNQGNLLVNLTSQVLLTSYRIQEAIRDNETITMDFILKNEDGAVAVDLPSMTLGDGSLDLPRNESVKINVEGEIFEDDVLGYSMGVSTLPLVP